MLDLGGKFLDFLYPKQCLGCDLWFSFGRSDVLCAMCEKTLAESPQILQRILGDTAVFSRFSYSHRVVAKTVQALKYEHIFDAAEICGNWVKPIFGQFSSENTIIIPVPLHVSRLRERGYNQSELICYAARGNSDLVFQTDLLVRARKTAYQALLSEEARCKNVAGVFSTTRLCDPNKKYVIVDDVVTSGSTIEDCSRALRRAGARDVFGITVASTSE